MEVYSENANKYERLGDWAERIGWESFFELTGLEFTHHLIDDFRDPAYYTWRQSTQFKFSELALAAHGGEAHEAASAAEVTAEDKEIVINFLKDKMSRPGAKTKYYFKDFLELFPRQGHPRRQERPCPCSCPKSLWNTGLPAPRPCTV